MLQIIKKESYPDEKTKAQLIWVYLQFSLFDHALIDIIMI